MGYGAKLKRGAEHGAKAGVDIQGKCWGESWGKKINLCWGKTWGYNLT